MTPSMEDYLEEIYSLSISGSLCRPKELSERLNVSMPSVTKALQRLNCMGFIEYEAYGDVSLTEQGIKIGKYLVHRNCVLKEFMALLGIQGSEEIAEEVESLEHYISPAVLIGIEELIHRICGDDTIERSRIENKEQLELFLMKNGLERVKYDRRFGGKSL